MQSAVNLFLKSPVFATCAKCRHYPLRKITGLLTGHPSLPDVIFEYQPRLLFKPLLKLRNAKLTITTNPALQTRHEVGLLHLRHICEVATGRHEAPNQGRIMAEQLNAFRSECPATVCIHTIERLICTFDCLGHSGVLRHLHFCLNVAFNSSITALGGPHWTKFCWLHLAAQKSTKLSVPAAPTYYPWVHPSQWEIFTALPVVAYFQLCYQPFHCPE